MDNVENLFTLASIGTFAGASAAVTLVANTVRKLAGWASPWPAFITSAILAAIGAVATDSLRTVPGIFVAILNACLLFCTATGIQEVAVAGAQPAGGARPQGKQAVRWLSSWFR